MHLLDRKQTLRLALLLAGAIVAGCDGDAASLDTGSDPNPADSATDTDSGTAPADSATDTDSGTAAGGSDRAEPWTSPVTDAFTEVGRDEIGDVPFRQDTLLEYHVFMDPPLYEEMETRGNDEVYREAALRVRGGDISEDFALVGIRHKGDYSLHHCWDDHGGVRSRSGECAKLSIKIKFDKHNERARFFGLKRINLHAMSEDDTKLRERLTYDMFNAFGVTTARTAHAKLIVNDNEPLLVLAVEQIDGRFTAHRYPSGGDGNLYKETWPTAPQTEAELLPQLRTNDNLEDAPDVSRFIAFGKAVAAASPATFVADMAEFVEMEQLLRYMAVDRAVKNWDGITAFYWPNRPHNLFWYHDAETSNLFHIIPWDHDKALWEYDPYMDPERHTGVSPVPDWNVLPASCVSLPVWYGSVAVYPPGCDDFINLLAATGWDDFVALGQELLDSVMQYDVMNEKITAWADQIALAVADDPLIASAAWASAVADFRGILKKSILDFEAHLTKGYIIEK